MAWVANIGGADVSRKVERITIIHGLREGGEATLDVSGLNPLSFAPVLITQGGAEVFGGLVGPARGLHDGAELLEGSIRCLDEVTALRYALVSESYDASVASIVQSVVAKYAPELALACDAIATNAKVKYNYLPLLEVLRGLAKTGGAQFIAYGGTLRFFREYWGDVVEIPYANVVTPYDYSCEPEEIVNDVYVVGGAARASTERTWIGNGIATEFAYDKDLVNVAVTLNGAPQSLVLDGFTAPAGAQVFLSTADRRIRFAVAPPASAAIRLTGQYDYTVVERLQEFGSINKYGRRFQRVINDTSIQDKATARAMAQNELQVAPKEYLRFDLINFQPILAGRKVRLPWLNRYGRVTQSTMVLDANESIRLEVELL